MLLVNAPAVREAGSVRPGRVIAHRRQEAPMQPAKHRQPITQQADSHAHRSPIWRLLRRMSRRKHRIESRPTGPAAAIERRAPWINSHATPQWNGPTIQFTPLLTRAQRWRGNGGRNQP